VDDKVDVIDDSGKVIKKDEKIKPDDNKDLKPDLTTEAFSKLQDQLADSESKNKRLLSESFENKKKYTTLRDSVDSDNQKKLVEKENWKELYETEKTAHEETTGKYNLTKKEVLQKSLDFEVARFATDAHDARDIINNLDRKNLVIDEATLEVSGIKEEVVRLRTDKSFLFKQNKMPTTVDTPPGNKIVPDGKLHYDYQEM